MNVIHKENCPICQTKLIRVDRPLLDPYYICINKCYKLISYLRGSHCFVTIFEKQSELNYSSGYEKLKTIVAEVTSQINYWKENDRYLVKILEGGN